MTGRSSSGAATDRDVDGLMALYDRLDDDDRYRRFFSLYRPDRAFFDRMVACSDSGGLELVAEVSAPDAEAHIVGEASYTLLANGDGELAITVDDQWRGWLGPYLLDALLARAAARGIPNLEADILLANRAMLALARTRGYATQDNTDWTTVRVLVGTGARAPSWPRRDARPRVLVEVPGGRWHATNAAREAGLQVLACPGPEVNRRCPVLAGRPCPLARDADAIVMSLREPVQPEWEALLEGHSRLHEGVPICVELPRDEDLPLPENAVRASTDGGATSIVALVQRIARHAEASRAET